MPQIAVMFWVFGGFITRGKALQQSSGTAVGTETADYQGHIVVNIWLQLPKRYKSGQAITILSHNEGDG
jgi:hypothetical protein